MVTNKFKKNRKQNLEMVRSILQYHELGLEHQSGYEMLVSAIEEAICRNIRFYLPQILDGGDSHE